MIHKTPEGLIDRLIIHACSAVSSGLVLGSGGKYLGPVTWIERVLHYEVGYMAR